MHEGTMSRQIGFSFVGDDAVVMRECPRCHVLRRRHEWHEGQVWICRVCRNELGRTSYRDNPADRERRLHRSVVRRQVATTTWRSRQLAALHSPAGCPCAQP
jgi:ribosomal protein L37AE/L43A